MHKAECANLKRISPKIVPDAARLMARVIIKLNQGGADEVGYYTETKFRKFKDLMSRKWIFYWMEDFFKRSRKDNHVIGTCIYICRLF